MNMDVNMGEVAFGEEQDDLVSLGIGSCVIVTLYDAKNKIGAMAHIMLPANSKNKELGKRDLRYVDDALDEMMDRLKARGSKNGNLEAKLIGGANMFSAFASDIGKDNVSSAEEKLKKEGVEVIGKCVGGSQGRSVKFSVASGIVSVKIKF